MDQRHRHGGAAQDDRDAHPDYYGVRRQRDIRCVRGGRLIRLRDCRFGRRGRRPDQQAQRGAIGRKWHEFEPWEAAHTFGDAQKRPCHRPVGSGRGGARPPTQTPRSWLHPPYGSSREDQGIGQWAKRMSVTPAGRRHGGWGRRAPLRAQRAG